MTNVSREEIFKIVDTWPSNNVGVDPSHEFAPGWVWHRMNGNIVIISKVEKLCDADVITKTDWFNERCKLLQTGLNGGSECQLKQSNIELENRDKFIGELLERVNNLEKNERDLKDVLMQCRSTFITFHPEVQSSIGKRVIEKKIRIINWALNGQEK